MQETQTTRRGARAYLALIGIGLAAGLLSGLFGVGGGTIIVPLLVLLLGFDQRRAAGTSLAAIVPIAAVGVISYAVSGSVSWVAALVLAVGAVLGAQIGTRLLPRISQRALLWGFVGFIAVVIVSLFLIVPSRAAELELTWTSGLILAVVGVFTGVLAGLIGVGGGIIVVPALMLGMGASDLIAKGTSLLTMIPTAVSGTIGNLRHHNVDLVAAAVVGVSACATTALGAMLAAFIDPFVGNVLFAVYLLYIGYQMSRKALRAKN